MRGFARHGAHTQSRLSLIHIYTEIKLDVPEIDELVVCRWNRAYPFDRRVEITPAWHPVSEYELVGSSHDKITVIAVSYTHLDVYKRQGNYFAVFPPLSSHILDRLEL